MLAVRRKSRRECDSLPEGGYTRQVPPTATSFRLLSALAIALFCLASAVQWNDPDPLRWAALYAAAAVVTARVVWGGMGAVIPAALGAIALVWAVALLPAAMRSSFPELFRTWQMMGPAVEVGREALGLLIVAVWMGVLFRQSRARKG